MGRLASSCMYGSLLAWNNEPPGAPGAPGSEWVGGGCRRFVQIDESCPRQCQYQLINSSTHHIQLHLSTETSTTYSATFA